MLYNDKNDKQKDKIRFSVSSGVLSSMVIEAAQTGETLSDVFNRVMSDYFMDKNKNK